MNSLGNKAIMAANIKKYLDRTGKSQKEVCKDLGFKESTFSDWLNAKVYPRIDKIEMMANYFGIKKADLVEDNSVRPSIDFSKFKNIYSLEVKQVPMLGKIACGKPIMSDEVFSGYVQCGAQIHADFCLRAEGDSMIGARIYDGDIVFIRQQPEVENGEIAAVAIDDSVTLKRVYVSEDYIELIAENPKFKPMRIRKEDAENVKILGKAVAFQGDVI